MEFHSTKGKSYPLSDSNFLATLAFLVELLTPVNTLNQALQGKTATVLYALKGVRVSTEERQFSFPTTNLSDRKWGHTTRQHSNIVLHHHT